MEDSDGGYLDVGYTEGGMNVQFLKIERRNGDFGISGGHETIWQTLMELLGAGWFYIYRHGEQRQRPQVVETTDVVVVVMGDKYGRKEGLRCRAAHHLFAEIGTAVDENAGANVRLQECRGAQPAVAWIGRPAHAAVAPNLRNAATGACAKKKEFHMKFTSG